MKLGKCDAEINPLKIDGFMRGNWRRGHNPVVLVVSGCEFLFECQDKKEQDEIIEKLQSAIKGW